MKNIISEKAFWQTTCFNYLKLVLVVTCLLPANLTQAEDCLLKKQLNDPYIRAEYDEVIEAYRTNTRNSDVESMYGNIRPASFSERANITGGRSRDYLDPISKECITCHDGTLAREAKHRITSGYQQQSMSIETIVGAHPVGMDYDQYRWNKQYVSADRFPEAMVLMDGKVTCITCHDLLGKNQKYLVVDNYRSGLCFSCHIK